MTENQSVTESSEEPPREPKTRSFGWLIPIITTVVAIVIVVVGLLIQAGTIDMPGIPEEPGFMTVGQQLYQGHCANCHGSDGQGAGRHFPPLVGTHRVLHEEEELILIVLHGLRGPIEVDGQTYDALMPRTGHRFDDEEIAEILTYVRTSWGNDAEPVTADEVARVRQAYPRDAGPWTEATLQAR